MEALRRRVVRAVRRACPTWLAGQAEDIVQNVLAQLMTRTGWSETDPGFSAIYLEKAAYGATVDEIRRLGRRKENPVAEVETMDRAPSPTAGPDRQAASREVGEGIRQCLTGLILPRRLAVTLYLQGCAVREIAERRRWTFKRAHNLVYRGLGDLRTCLERKGLAP
jgi:RNA polymerase sigma-70 factor (ECF subfamily)